MPEVAEQQPQQQVEQTSKTQEQQDAEQQQGRTYTEAEWNARQKEFDGKANKIRRNAARETELKFRREMDARREQPQQRQQEPAEPAEPKREDFPDYEAYLSALARHAGETAAREQRKKDEKVAGEKQAAEQTQQQLREFKKNLDTVVSELPEFEELLDAASEENLNLPPAMGEAIREAGVTGARVLHYLLANRAELDRIMNLKSSAAQAKEVGKIEVKIEAELEAAKKAKDKPKDENDGEQQRAADDADAEEEREERPRGEGGRFKAPEQETRRKAPDPIEPVSGRGGNTSTTPSDKDSDAVWLQKREAEIARERDAERKRRAG